MAISLVRSASSGKAAHLSGEKTRCWRLPKLYRLMRRGIVGANRILPRRHGDGVNSVVYGDTALQSGDTGASCDLMRGEEKNGENGHFVEKRTVAKDISGQRFHRLVAEYATTARDTKGFVVWHCRCDCGNEIDVSYNRLVYGNMKSCGCLKKERDQMLGGFLTHVNGTSLDLLKSKKVPKDNTSGVKGVYFIRGKYVAKIVFQRKAYYLGTYDSLEEAAEARRRGEEVLCDGTVAFYEKWQAKAAADPVWAAQNPVKFQVTKTNHGLEVEMLPHLTENDE